MTPWTRVVDDADTLTRSGANVLYAASKAKTAAE